MFLSSFPGGSVTESPPAKQETWVWFLGQQDPLEKEIETHSSDHMERKAWWATVHGAVKDSDMT